MITVTRKYEDKDKVVYMNFENFSDITMKQENIINRNVHMIMNVLQKFVPLLLLPLEKVDLLLPF